MKRNNSFVIILTILISVAFYFSGLPIVMENAPVWSIVSAAAITAAVSSVLYFINVRFGTRSGLLLPPIYIILASVNPKALLFNPLHPATLAVAVGLYFCIKFFREDQHNQDAFTSQLFVGIASCFFPPAIWIAPIGFLSGLAKTKDTARFTFNSTVGLLLPIAVWAGVSYLVGGVPQLKDFFASLAAGSIAVGPKSIYYSSATIIRMVAVAALTIAALASLRKNLLIVFMVVFCIIALLFFNNSGEPFCIWTSLAVALPLNSFLAGSGPRHRWIFIALVCFLLIAERITFYL